MPDAMSEASLSLIRSRTVRRPISAFRYGAREKMLVGAGCKLVPLLVQLRCWSGYQTSAQSCCQARAGNTSRATRSQLGWQPEVFSFLGKRESRPSLLDARFRGHDTGPCQVIARALKRSTSDRRPSLERQRRSAPALPFLSCPRSRVRRHCALALAPLPGRQPRRCRSGGAR
jgi:hypothetical protein